MPLFRFEINHYHHSDKEVLIKLDTILSGVTSLFAKVLKMSVELQKVVDEVTELKTINGSAISLLKKLGQLIKDNIDDKVALTQIANDLDSEGKAISDAVTENTPAE